MGSPRALETFGSRERGWQRGWLESRSRFEAVPELQILFGITTRSRSFRVERAWVAKELIGSEIKVRSSAGVTDPFRDHYTLLKLSGRESRGIVSVIPRGWQRGWLESRSRFETVPELQILSGITTRS
jgi:hypothetical protein